MKDSKMFALSLRSRGLTLVEVLISMVLAGILGTLALRALTDIHRFYQKVSEQSREVSNATVALDRLEAFAFGLPRQSFTLGGSSNGQPSLVIQPQTELAASGAAIYSTGRWIIENRASGVWLWTVEGQPGGLGLPLTSFPPPAGLSRSSLLLGPGWRFTAAFQDGGFPLRLSVAPPSEASRSFQRDIEGYL